MSTVPVVFDDKLFILFLNDIWSTVDGSLWVRETTSPFPFRQHYKTVVFQDELFIIAGIGSPHSSPHNEIWKSNYGINWSEVTTVYIFSPRVQHAVTVYDDKVRVIGGYPEHRASTPTRHNDIWHTNDMEVW